MLATPEIIRESGQPAQLAERLPADIPAAQVVQVADAALAPRLTAATRSAIAASANAADALALLLASPEFQRR